MSGRLTVLLRRHWPIAALVGAGAVIRILVMIAYAPAFWFRTDSGDYLDLSTGPYPHQYRPLGYPLLLAALRPTGSLATVAAVQHLAGLALAVGIYALLVRRGVSRGVASLAAVPLLFDSLQVDLEHFLLTETLYMVLLAAGIGVLLWYERPGRVAGTAAGLLLAGAWLTRPVALGVFVVLGAYLLARRVGWRVIAVYVVAFAVPWAALLVKAGDDPGIYGSSANSVFLFGRTAMIADCDHLELTPEERSLCPTTAVDQRADRADYYIWVHLSDEYRGDPAHGPVMRGFAVAVITQQPGDYLALVARESAPYFLPWQKLPSGLADIAAAYVLPASVRDTGGIPLLAGPGYTRDPLPQAASPGATGLTGVLHWYGVHVRTPAILTTLVVLAAIAALVVARRRRGWRDALDAGLLVFVGVALLVGQVATGTYEPRYGLPTVPLFCVAAGLAWQVLRQRRPAPAQGQAEPVPPSSSSESR